MSVVRIVSIFPTPENAAPMRSLLEEDVRSTPGTSLSVNVLGEMPTFVETTVLDSLEDYQKNRDALAADPAVIEHRTKIGQMSRQPVVVRLLRPIVSPVEPMGQGRSINQRVVFFPTPEGAASLRSTLEEFCKGQQADGRVHARMATVLFPHDGAAFTLGDSYENMAELENVMRSREAAVAGLTAKIATTQRQAAIHRLMEVIVPAN